MLDTEKIKMPLTSADLLGERIEALRDLFPEVFTEDKIDFDGLKLALGEQVAEGHERYGLTWPGKAEAIRAIQTPSTGTLVPMPDESVNFDTAKNLIIEGDNLEVLKLLQKSYHGKVKMIYIDPPYNTGNEFIYPDNFREGLQEYLRFAKQLGDDNKRVSSASEIQGRYHSSWLSMMYPRLFLARNLLRDDGAIFVSIDDNEVQNLRHLLDEIFGPENFVATICWQKKQSPQSDATYISDMHDYIVVYARRAKSDRGDTTGLHLNLFPRDEEQLSRYNNVDGDERGPWTSADATCNKTADERPNLYYSIRNPHTGEEVWPSRQRVWAFEQSKSLELLAENRLWWGGDGTGFPRVKRFLHEVQGGVVPGTFWDREEFGDNQEAAREIRHLFPDSYGVFSTPKPTRLLRKILQIATSSDPDGSDIVLDFFAGSGTLAHATIDQNLEDKGNRRYILVQIPEPTGRDDLVDIASICRERVRRVIHERQTGVSGAPNALNSHGGTADGFRAFKLTSSGFKVWTSDYFPHLPDRLARQLEFHVDPLLPERSQTDVLFELVLKAGLPLTVPIEKVSVSDGTAYLVDGDTLLICLEPLLSERMLDAMMEREPVQVICIDSAFQGNDQLKTNTVLEMMSHNIEFRTV